MLDVIIIGAGPAGVVAALRAGDLGAKTALVTSGPFGGMAANDGPVPVRTLAHAARLLREARQLSQYGITIGEPVLDYSHLLRRVREVTNAVRSHSSWRSNIDELGVDVYENAGSVHFEDAHTVRTSGGLQLVGKNIIICTGGSSRRLSVPGSELTATHSDAWKLQTVPPSMLVIGAGATGAQVASVFNAFGSRVQLFHRGPRILATEDHDVSTAMADAFRNSGIDVKEDFGVIDSFEKSPTGVRMRFTKDGEPQFAEASLAVIAVGWVANTSQLGLPQAAVETNRKGFIEGPTMRVPELPAPVGSFTDPEYAQVGLTESKARQSYDVEVAFIRFDQTTRTIIDGRTTGFCKLIVDRATRKILGCHVVGERAVEISQVAAVAMSAGMLVDDLARVPLSFPTYAGVLGRLAANVTRKLNMDVEWQGAQ
jgi:pyruvate/2-oxoglutarate dehydrogenase complex dihydrolipoamide dehydrogenase (E3) component